MTIISFTSVKKPFGWLGNMAPFPIKIGHGKDEETFRTTEALFQAFRFGGETPELIAMRKEIQDQKSPMAAKMIAKSHLKEMTVVPQSKEDIDSMKLCLFLKVEQHNLKQQLLDTGDATIIEDCTNRQHGSGLFWGAALQEDGTWKGENVLGKLWMELRDMIKEDL